MQVLCSEAKTTSMPGEGGKGQEKSPCAEQAVAHCHRESWGRKRIRRRLYNPQVKQRAQARPVGSPVIVFTVNLPITLIPSHACCRWSLVSVVCFTICRPYCEQLQSWEVSKQRCRSPPRGEDGRHREGAYMGGLTKLQGRLQVTPKSRGLLPIAFSKP